MKLLQSVVIAILIVLTTTTMKAQKYPKASELTGLEIGAKAPVFKALNQNKETFYLEDALKKGPAVIIFYRGFWCPVCNKHLKNLQDSLALIYDKGATVVAISPEKPEYLQKMERKSEAEFTLLYDEDYKISDAYGLTFKPDSATLVLYNTALNAQLKKSHSDNSQRLPIPATYIINRDGIIIWRQFNPDYKIRASVKDIVDNLNK